MCCPSSGSWPRPRPPHDSPTKTLVRSPSLLLCDEPTGNLDRASADAVTDLLVALHRDQQTMLVVVTHSAAIAARFDRRYELRDVRLHPVA